MRYLTLLAIIWIFPGCISMKQYKADAARINQNIAVQNDMNTAMVKALNMCRDSIQSAHEHIGRQQSDSLTLDARITNLENKLKKSKAK